MRDKISEKSLNNLKPGENGQKRTGRPKGESNKKKIISALKITKENSEEKRLELQGIVESHSKSDWRAAAWLLEKVWPDIYSVKEKTPQLNISDSEVIISISTGKPKEENGESQIQN